MADDNPENDSATGPVAGQRSTGRVKWFNNTKGFGFIVADGSDGDSDLFAHYSAIDMNGYRTLKAGQHVSFTTADGPKGLHAMDIRAADDLEPSTSNERNDNDDVSHPGIDVELPNADANVDKHDDDLPDSAAQR